MSVSLTLPDRPPFSAWSYAASEAQTCTCTGKYLTGYLGQLYSPSGGGSASRRERENPSVYPLYHAFALRLVPRCEVSGAGQWVGVLCNAPRQGWVHSLHEAWCPRLELGPSRQGCSAAWYGWDLVLGGGRPDFWRKGRVS